MDSAVAPPLHGVQDDDYQMAHNTVFLKSDVPSHSKSVQGIVSGKTMVTISSMETIGFQATNLALALEIVNAMLAWKPGDDANQPHHEDSSEDEDVSEKTYPLDPLQQVTLYVALAYPLAATNVRDALTFLTRHKCVHHIILSGGCAEVDVALACSKSVPEEGGRLSTDALLEKWFYPWCKSSFLGAILSDMPQTQTFTPVSLMRLLGQVLATSEPVVYEDSFVYWAYVNNIPIYVPSFSDGTLSEILAIQAPQIVVDLVPDLCQLNNSAIRARKTGMMIFGGGVVKHHTCNANLMRNGADYAVYINTGEEYDGSDGGARPEEAVSWGKIRRGARSVKVHTDATLAIPFFMAHSFVPYIRRQMEIADTSV